MHPRNTEKVQLLAKTIATRHGAGDKASQLKNRAMHRRRAGRLRACAARPGGQIGA